MKSLIIPFIFSFLPAVTSAEITSSQGDLVVTPVVQDLDRPWGFDFLPKGGVILTENGGTFLLSIGQAEVRVNGPRDIRVQGQGGLLDVMVPRDFERSGQIYFTYSTRVSGGTGTALGRAELDVTVGTLINFQRLYAVKRGTRTGRHFGSRLIEGNDGKIYMTVGDHGDRPSAQDTEVEHGSILRLNRDGTIPADNPLPNNAIYSFGHRNPQGLTMDARGWIVGIEHGPAGGDEVNVVQKGKNFGWPMISYGTHYSGAKVGRGTQQSGMEQPAQYWDPSIAPSGAMVYSGKMFPTWKDHIFTGSLKFGFINVSSPLPKPKDVETLKSRETQRVRDVDEAPDGSIWFLNEPDGVLYRISH